MKSLQVPHTLHKSREPRSSVTVVTRCRYVVTTINTMVEYAGSEWAPTTDLNSEIACEVIRRVRE